MNRFFGAVATFAVRRGGFFGFTISPYGATDDSDEALVGDAFAHYWRQVARLKRRLGRETGGPVSVAAVEARLKSLGIVAPKREKASVPLSFAGERLSEEGMEALRYAGAIKAANPAMAPTAIARETTLLLQERAQPVSRPASVEVIWRAARMPVSSTGAPFADPATGTITSRFPPDMLSACRQDIETRHGPILSWTETKIVAKPAARPNAQPAHDPDGWLYKKIKRLVGDHLHSPPRIVPGTEATICECPKPG